MPTLDPRIDAYIAKAQPFAQPILTHLREVVHADCPEVVETIKWGMPTFEHHGILAAMAAFKAHAVFGFWKGELVTGLKPEAETAMWGFGRLAELKQLPSKRVLSGFVKKAMRLNEEGVAARRPVKHKKAAALPTPDDLATMLKRNARARRAWTAFSAAKRREYVEWIVEAKRAATRERRMLTALEWIEEGKSRNWRYEK